MPARTGIPTLAQPQRLPLVSKDNPRPFAGCHRVLQTKSSTNPSPSSSAPGDLPREFNPHLISISNNTVRLLSSYRAAGGRLLIISLTLHSVSTRQPAATCCSHIHLRVLFVEDTQYSLHIPITLSTRCHQDASIRCEGRRTSASVALPLSILIHAVRRGMQLTHATVPSPFSSKPWNGPRSTAINRRGQKRPTPDHHSRISRTKAQLATSTPRSAVAYRSDHSPL